MAKDKNVNKFGKLEIPVGKPNKSIGIDKFKSPKKGKKGDKK